MKRIPVVFSPQNSNVKGTSINLPTRFICSVKIENGSMFPSVRMLDKP